jgi:hypothetical protein
MTRAARPRCPGPIRAGLPRGKPAADSAAAAVGALYQDHAVGLIWLAYLMPGDRASVDRHIATAIW